jgi:serine/threonine protein kinase/tetratricopeptide (TPR) repeat protein
MFPESAGLSGAQQIGEGGAGRVYSACHSQWGQVAVKVAIDSDPAAQSLFISEYTLLRSLSHPGIIRLFDFGRTLDHRSFIVMELLSGGDFYSWATGQPVERRFQPLGGIISALDYIHTLGIIHRDLKGENILFDGRHRARVTDLGLATSESESRNTRAGTLEYMAPEVIDNREATPAADIYSLGVILFRLATGRLPFESSDPLQIISLKHHPDELDGEMIAAVASDRFAEMVRRCLDPDPALRPRSVTEVAEQLLLANLMKEDDVVPRSINNYLHHHIRGYNASYVKQELRHLTTDYLIRDYHQGATTGLLEMIADSLKTSGHDATHNSPGTLSYTGTDGHQHTICLVDAASSPVTQTTVEYPELDRFAFDAILAKLFPAGIEDAIGERLYEYSGGNINLLRLLLAGLERQSLVDLKAGRILLQRDRLFEFEPADEYFETIAAMLPELPEDLATAVAFLSADPFGNLPGALIATSRVTKETLPALADLGILTHDDYHFMHSYYREYYYHSLSVSERTTVHQEWVAQIDRGQVSDGTARAEQLFYHLAGAAETGRAIETAIALAQRFRKEQQPDKARMLLTRVSALPIASAGVDLQLRLLMISARIYKDAGDFGNALSDCARSVRLAKRSDNKAILTKVYENLGDIYKSKRDYRRGSRVLNRAVKLYGELGDELGLSHCFNNIGNILWIVGDLKGAATNYETALEVQRRLGAKKDIASSLSNLGGIKLVQHQYDDSIALYKESIAIKREIGDWPELARTANNLAGAYYEMDELQVANGYLNESLRINLSQGADEEILFNYWNLYEVEFRRGNVSKAAEWLYAGLRLAKQSDHFHRGNFSTFLASLMITVGRYGKAGHLLRVAEKFEQQVDDRMLALRLMETRGEYYRLLFDWDQAHAHIADGIVLADSLGESTGKVRLLVMRARVDRAAGEQESVIWEALTEAEDLVKSIPAQREKLTILLDKTEYLIESNRLTEAQEEYAQVRLLPQFEGINTLQSRISFLNGLIDLRSGQYRQAITLFNDACLASKTLQMPEMTWKTLVALGETYQALTEYERAFKCYIEAFDILKRLASGIADPTCKRRYLSDVAKIAVADKLETISALAT